MGILGATGMIAGQEATSAARAAAIAENIDKLASAMMIFYAENSAEVDQDGKIGGEAVTVETLASGVNAYLKNANADTTAPADNAYFAAVNGEGAAMTWWIGYQFGTLDDNNQVRSVMANKAVRMGLVTAVSEGEKYAGGNVFYMKVR